MPQGLQCGEDAPVSSEHFRQLLVKLPEQGQLGQKLLRLGVQQPQGGFVYVRAHLPAHDVYCGLLEGLSGGEHQKQDIDRHRAPAGFVPETLDVLGGKGEAVRLDQL